MTKKQGVKLGALFGARGRKGADGKTPLIDDDTHREWIEHMHEVLVSGRFPGAKMGEADGVKLEALHKHYLGD